MRESKATAGYFRGGLPYNRSGNGPRPLVVFQGLLFENKPQPGLMVRFYKFLEEEYTLYEVLRRPGMPRGYTMEDMADNYARMIREEFGGPVDVVGVSTGGSIAQHFAADHPDLVRRLVIHSSAHALSNEAKRLQMRVAHLAQQRRWVKASAIPSNCAGAVARVMGGSTGRGTSTRSTTSKDKSGSLEKGPD